MNRTRKIALVAGILYLLTFVSIPSPFVLYDQVRNNREYILGAGPDTPVFFGGILEIIVALAGIGTAVTLYPVLKRQNEAAALALVGARVLESAGILAGVASLLAIVSLRQAGAGPGAVATGQTLALLYGRIFLLSQSLMPIVCDLLLGVLLYRSRLVPRVLPLIALVGAPLLAIGDLGALFNLWGATSSVTALVSLPVAVFEFSLGVYLIVKGFKPSPILADDTRPVGTDAGSPARAALAG